MKLRTREMAVFAMLGTIMYASKVIMEQLGFPVGNCVFPMRRHTQEQRAALIADLEKAGFSFGE